MERAFTQRISLPLTRWLTPGFGTLVYAPHVFHFSLMLLLLVWKPDVDVPRVGVLAYLAPAMGLVGVIIRLFLIVHQALFSLVNLGFGLGAILLLFDSRRRVTVPRIRQQLNVIAIGLCACLVCYSASTSIPQLLNITVAPAWRAGLAFAALTLGPGSIAFAIVAYKFLDARLLARRAIIYALGSAALVGLYLVLVTQLTRFLRGVPGLDSRVIEPVFLVMALVMFQPIVARLEEVLDRAMLRDPTDYRNVLRQLGRDLQTTIDLEELEAHSIRTVTDTLLLRSGHIVARVQDGMVANTAAGEPLAAAAIAELNVVLPRVSARQTSYRVSEPIEGLTEHERRFLEHELKLSLLVPLRWRGELVGALLLGDKLTGTRFSSEDQTLLTTLASQLSVSMQNALLLRDRVAVARFEQELDLARRIQRTSLLSEFPPVPRCEVHAVYVPSRQVGGDFYDVVAAGDGSHLLAIADVSGKGVPAAMLSSMLQASLRTQAGSRDSLETILRNINTLLYRSTEAHQFATFFLARVDGERMQLSFSNAGHNWPVLLRPNGERVFLERGGTPLGIIEGAVFEEATVSLEPGDRVVMYTDGISEATNREGVQYGEERLCAVVERLAADLPAHAIAQRVIEDLHAHLDGVEPQDDITMLVVRVLERVPSLDGLDLEAPLESPVSVS